MRVFIEAILVLVFVVSAVGSFVGVASYIESVWKSYKWSPDDRIWLRGFIVIFVLSASGLVLLFFPPPGG